MKKKKTIILSVSVILFLIVITLVTFIYKDDPLSTIHVKQYESETVKEFKIKFSGLTGKHIKIGIIDSPVDSSHADLKGKIKETIVFTTNNNRNASTESSHGTQVAGIIAAKDNGYGILGIAPDAEIYSLVAIDSNGLGKTEDVCKALKWCIDNQMDVVNLSFSIKVCVLSIMI